MSAAPPDNDVLWARGIVKSQHGTPALRGVSLAVREGEVLAVTGPRGSGKSTLLGCLSAQLPVDEGEIWFHSSPVHTLGRLGREKLRRERFGWVGSEPHLVPELTARENTALPLLLAGTGHRAAYTAASEWLERLDVADCAARRPAELTQAQRQRIAVARALAPLPRVVFADDPGAPLHREEREQVLRILASAARSHNLTMLLATHDPEPAGQADRTLTLIDGRIAGPASSTAGPAAGTTIAGATGSTATGSTAVTAAR
ncbi:ABC transporter ATP-binding protein [Kitasatospora sp. DSM 101779]|uniref:ABC transporter ATP-binding protein n=1 Tax=Kitasatospora sp. DSM 101779 TaxID=2853165 RepID=UPI0021D84A91|nr:ATP-binding cassette domain-containing protein [Kitasatospora sp. DSM 101779]MCU7822631.1 ATP-binding cassette domain-containing protein [Kitasatospora sp. DSM 101779]